MATKKEIKELLKELKLTESDMDNYWNELIETNWKIKNLNQYGKTWRDLNTYVIKELPTQKEKDLAAAEERRIKEEQEALEKIRIEDEKKYYSEHFEEIMLRKIDDKENLTERELQELVWNSSETTYGENRRWSRGATTIIELCGRTFAIDWEEGLTESQENEFYNQPYEVRLNTYEKTITVTEWVAV